MEPSSALHDSRSSTYCLVSDSASDFIVLHVRPGRSALIFERLDTLQPLTFILNVDPPRYLLKSQRHQYAERPEMSVRRRSSVSRTAQIIWSVFGFQKTFLHSPKHSQPTKCCTILISHNASLVRSRPCRRRERSCTGRRRRELGRRLCHWRSYQFSDWRCCFCPELSHRRREYKSPQYRHCMYLSYPSGFASAVGLSPLCVD